MASGEFVGYDRRNCCSCRGVWSAKAFAYLRVGDKSQVDGDGFPRQLLAIQKLDFEIVQVFEERGVTAEAETAARPAWSEMLRQCKLQGVRFILIEKLDRLAGDLMVQETALRDTGQLGLTVVSSMEPDLCSKDVTRVLIRQIMGAIAQYDKNNLVNRLRGARERTQCQMGRKPYGQYDAEKPTLVLMKELYQSSRSYRAVALELNRRGIATRFKGSSWHAKTVAGILARG
jgi:DNA invertase Pin-like site-specific DNA recombinase